MRFAVQIRRKTDVKAAERRAKHVTYWTPYLNAIMTTPRPREAVWPPDFEHKCHDLTVSIGLEWRGLTLEFWTVKVCSSGIFRPKVEIDLEQARAIAAALEHFDTRNKAILRNAPTNNPPDREN